MAKYELPIYGENDEITKHYKTDHVKWAVFIDVADVAENFEKLSITEQIEAAGKILKAVFNGLTDEELRNADGFDVINTYRQIANGNPIKSGNSKNL